MWKPTAGALAYLCKLALFYSVVMVAGLSFLVAVSFAEPVWSIVTANRLETAMNSWLDYALFTTTLALMLVLVAVATTSGVARSEFIAGTRRYQKWVAPLAIVVITLAFSTPARPVIREQAGWFLGGFAGREPIPEERVLLLLWREVRFECLVLLGVTLACGYMACSLLLTTRRQRR